MNEPAEPTSSRSSTDQPRDSTELLDAGRPVRFEPPADCVLRLPNCCANCCAPSGASLRLEPPLGSRWRELLVPYCSGCAVRVESSKTRRAVGVGLGLLVGLVLLLGLPMARWSSNPFTYSLLAVAGTALPIWVAWLISVRKPFTPPQTSPDFAAWWDKWGLVGTNPNWMKDLAKLNEGAVSVLAPRKTLPLAGIVLPLSVGAIAPGLFHVLFPTLVVLNLTAEDFELYVDGNRRAVVGVTSLESTIAGTRLSLGAGPHLLEARSRQDADATERAEVHLDAGEEYLFAPGAEGYCFWLERTAYGGSGGESRVQPLGGKSGLYQLPSPVDTWFGPNPEPSREKFSTGGEMVAVRHGRCADKPGALRR